MKFPCFETLAEEWQLGDILPQPLCDHRNYHKCAICLTLNLGTELVSLTSNLFYARCAITKGCRFQVDFWVIARTARTAFSLSFWKAGRQAACPDARKS